MIGVGLAIASASVVVGGAGGGLPGVTLSAAIATKRRT